jgi:hypothetical protein
VIPLSEVTPIYLCSVRTCIYTYTIHHIYHELFICCIVMLTLNECTGKGKSENIHKILSFPGISLTAKCTHNYKHSASYCCSDLYDHHTFVFHHKWHQLITLCTKEQQCPVIQFLWAEGVRSGYVNWKLPAQYRVSALPASLGWEPYHSLSVTFNPFACSSL